ncbi:MULTISPECIES: fimbrial biogenesis chaperone [Acinetobacter]|jgi:P pilus assembly chaperone PapD|uniref:fimbrial biogenesis chaperone n=1 Tax=Acinetobacter TaxID=469 RepID=UPI0012502E93|nr:MULTISPECIES: molecular chaperone [Acinetobacter]UBQ39528.1 molecular chaperone [Acinetobacter johnsonii]
MRLNPSLFAIVLSGLAFASPSNAAIQAMASRVIYHSDSKAATLNLKNNASKPYIVQTWLEAGEDKTASAKVPFIVTPPLIKIEPQKESVLRFIYSGSGLPTDRESQVWINVQEIPPKPEEENTLQLAVRSKLKLFYRPQQIEDDLPAAVKKLQWSVEHGTLKLKNNSPLFITIGDLALGKNGQPITHMNQDMAPPFQSIDVLRNVPENVKSLKFTYINDYGSNIEMPEVILK